MVIPYNFAAGRFHTMKLCSRLYSIEIEFLFKKTKKCFLSHPLRDLGVTYTVYLYLVGKPVIDFLFIITELSRYLLRLRRYKRKPVEVGIFRRGGSRWAQISDGRGRRPPTTVSVRKPEWLPFRAVSKYLQLVHCLVLSQSTRVTDRQTDGQRDGQNYDFHDPATIIASPDIKRTTIVEYGRP